jgi:hypothetical protein
MKGKKEGRIEQATDLNSHSHLLLKHHYLEDNSGSYPDK